MPSPLAWKKKEITALGDQAVFGQGVEIGGFWVAAAGTGTTLTCYDDAAAKNDMFLPVTATLTVGQFVQPFGGLPIPGTAPDYGLMLNKGLYITVGGTGSPEIYVLYR